MKLIIVKPELHKFASCAEFAEAFKLGENDLVLTNEYIFNPYFGKLNLPVHTIFQEKYGAGEPTDVMVDAIAADAVKTGCKRIIAIGGGTVIDIAKVLAVSDGGPVDALYDNVANLEKRHGAGHRPDDLRNGQRGHHISIINRTARHQVGMASEKMFADAAVLVPELLSSLPFGVFATSSIDALVHAVESSLSPKATAYTKLFGYKAIEMIIRSYQKLVKEGREVLGGLMEDFLIASNYAGLAFGTAGCARGGTR